MNDWDQIWPYHITIQRQEWDVVEQWCEANFGKFGQRWYKLGVDPMAHALHRDYQTRWYFKTEKDAVFFRLRWA